VVSLHGTSQPPFVAGQGKPDVTPEELQTAVKQGNEIFQAVQRNLQMEVDDSTKKVVVKVVDQATGDVIRQMPSKEALSFLKQMQEQQGGNGSIIKGLA
jgi:flagellar protein FlaG